MTSISLSAGAARVLGCLVEKAATTPDAYPLSLNAVRVACNQTTNRAPVVDYDEATVQHALDELRGLELVSRNKAPGERAIKFRHHGEAVLEVDSAELAVLAVMLLRGAQTPGELRQRTDRLASFATTEEVEAVLSALATRGFVARLERRPGQKEHRWMQCIATESADHDVAAAPTNASVAASDGGAAHHDDDHQRSHVHAGTFAVVDPATAQTIHHVEVHDETEIRAKLARARAAQRNWASRSWEERSGDVRAWADAIAQHGEALARTTSRETGKPIAQARNEVRAVGDRIAWYLREVPNAVAPFEVSDAGGMHERVTYEPRGVVAHVSAWNYPYFVGLNSIVPALLCGNAVLYKPSEVATMTGLQLVDLAHGAGVPVDVLQCVTGGGATGAALVASGVDLVCFTGSYATGRAIARAAAEHLVPVQLELGGKDAVYVCDDVDVEAVAASVAEGVFYNAGQSCCAIERVYVHAAVHDRFCEALVEATQHWELGDPTLDETTVGPLARAAQPALLAAQVADAVEKGARLAVGGTPPQRPGNWYPPTILTGVDQSMRVMHEESFGPVIGVMAVRDDAQALALVNDSEYGLTAGVFSRDEARAVRLLEQCDVGTAYWNCSDRTSVALPWAGRRHSGLGVSMSLAGVRAFVHEKAWHLRDPT